MRGDNRLGAECQLWTHALGWEVRLEINGDLQRSEVFRGQDDVLTAAERERPRWARREYPTAKWQRSAGPDGAARSFPSGAALEACAVLHEERS